MHLYFLPLSLFFFFFIINKISILLKLCHALFLYNFLHTFSVHNSYFAHLTIFYSPFPPTYFIFLTLSSSSSYSNFYSPFPPTYFIFLNLSSSSSYSSSSIFSFITPSTHCSPRCITPLIFSLSPDTRPLYSFHNTVNTICIIPWQLRNGENKKMTNLNVHSF